ncbi:unnamed protein product [Paramecium primaurelia]|uniref:Uncharacterized protein n=1 Tax=Paramecium primaurelia TaxID=5886 RepID=A0A8S1NCQ5_PARPR|nr:unnamed protein product [Paramecium primaurelia]
MCCGMLMFQSNNIQSLQTMNSNKERESIHVLDQITQLIVLRIIGLIFFVLYEIYTPDPKTKKQNQDYKIQSKVLYKFMNNILKCFCAINKFLRLPLIQQVDEALEKFDQPEAVISLPKPIPDDLEYPLKYFEQIYRVLQKQMKNLLMITFFQRLLKFFQQFNGQQILLLV